MSTLSVLGQCDATFDFYNNKLRRANNSTIRPVILGDHGGTFSATPSGLTFNDVNTGEIGLTNSTPPNIYTISYTVGTCASTQEIVILNTGASSPSICYDTLNYDPIANCEAVINYSWQPEIESVFNLVNQTWPSNDTLLPLGLDSISGLFIWPKQYNLISENNWQPAVTASSNDQIGELPIILSSAFAFSSSGGIVSNFNDGLMLTVPMSNRTFHGVDVSFDFRYRYQGTIPTIATLFHLGYDNSISSGGAGGIEIATAPITGVGIAYNFIEPDGTQINEVVTGIFYASEDSYHNYHLKYDPETGVLEFFVDGIIQYTDSFIPGTIINYNGSNVNVGFGGLSNNDVDGYGVSSNIDSYNNLKITEIILEKRRTCKRFFNVMDATAPIIDCSNLDGVEFQINQNCDFLVPNFFDQLSFSENCELDTTSFSQSISAGSLLDLGSHNIDFSIEDINGNMASSCSAIINIIDTIPPAILCNTVSINLYSDDGNETIPDIENLNPYSFLDGCNTFIYSQSPLAGTSIGFGTTTITQSISDGINAPNTCSVDVNVLDLNCPNDTTIYANSTACGLVLNYTPPAIGNLVSGKGTGAFFEVGSHIEQYEYNAGEICEFEIIVLDTISPSLDCPSDTILQINNTLCEADYFWDLNEADNCTLNTPIFFDDTQISGASIGLGQYDYSILIGDVNGNSSQCFWNVEIIDTIAPDIQCLSTQYHIWTDGSPEIMPDLSYLTNIDILDNCADINFSQVPQMGVGITELDDLVTFSVNDNNGNTSQCSFPLIWKNIGPHTLSCPGNINEDNLMDPSSCSKIINFTEPTSAFGNVIQTSNEGSGSTFLVDSVYELAYTVEPIIDTVLKYSWNDPSKPIAYPVIGQIPTSWENNGSYILDSDGGYYIESTGPLNMLFPIELVSNLEGIEIGFRYAANINRSSKIFRTNPDFQLDVDSNFFARYKILLPGGIIQNVQASSIFDLPLDDVLHDYLFRYDNNSGVCQILLDGAIAWENPNPIPGAKLVFPNTSDFLFGTQTNGSNLIVDDFFINKYTTNPECTFEILVEDKVVPEFHNCPEDTTLFASINGCNPEYYYTISGYDLCGDVTLVKTQGLGQGSQNYSQPITTNTWEIYDENGNVNVCSFKVNYVDDLNAEIICPNDTVVFNDPGICGAQFNFNLDTLFACNNLGFSVQEFTGNISSGSIFPIGVTSNEYQLLNGGGDVESTCSFNLEVRDIENPVFTNPPLSDTLYSDMNSCEIDYTFSLAGNDNCSNFTIDGVEEHSSPLGLGTYSFTYEIIDDSNNMNSHSWEIVVLDTISPVFTECPNDITVYSLADNCGDTVSYSIEAEDNCTVQNDLIITQLSGEPNNQYLPIGTYNQFYEVRDESNNVGYCQFIINVVDTISPHISCPNDTILIAENDLCSSQFNYSIEVSDNCNLTSTATIITGLASGESFPLGLTQMQIEIVDNALNSNQCQFDVIVEDHQDPIIDCPSSQTISIEADTCVAYFNHDMAIVENCNLFSITNGISELIEDTLDIGIHTYDFEVIDNSGNSSACSFEITVEDLVGPNLECSDVFLPVNESCEYQVPDFFLDPELYDCSGVETFSQFPLPNQYASGTTIITISTTDFLGNESNCFFELFSLDTIPPSASNCIPDTTIYSLPNECGNYFNYSILPIDNCGIQDSIINGPESGNFLGIGNHPVEFFFWDTSGLHDSCSFEVTVIDNVLPTFNCADVIAEDLDNDCEEQAHFLLLADDNCGIAEINQISGPLSGAIFQAGETEITYEAIDIHGNRDTCSFNVIVKAGLNWSINCPIDQNIVTDVDCNFIVPDYTSLALLNDVCNNSIGLSQDPAPGSLQSGVTEITIFGADLFGTIRSCSFNLLPFDNVAPIIECPNDTTVYVGANHCQTVLPYQWNTIDGCGVDSIQFIGYDPNDSIPIGNHPIEIVAFDGSLNSDTCLFYITVVDSVAPELSCETVELVDIDGDCEHQINFTLEAEDNCQVASIQQLSGPLSGDIVAVGDYTVKYYATDIYNNSDTCEFLVSLLPNEAWTIECPENDTIFIQDICDFQLPDFTNELNLNANCTEFELNQNVPEGTIISSDTTIEIVATDHNSNSMSCSFEVVLYDTISPSVEISLLSIMNDSLNCGAIVNYNLEAIDNCGTPSVTMLNGISSGSQFPLGSTLLIYQASDLFGNIHIDSLEVTVTDNFNPQIACDNLIQACDTNVVIDEPTVFDACGIDQLFNSFNNTGDASGIYPVGTSFINWTVIDVNGNENNCFQEIFVEVQQDIPNAGTDQTILFDNETNLNAQELLNNNGFWTQLNGNANILDLNNPNTFVNDLSIGLNEFIWTVEYEVCENLTDTVAVNVFDITMPSGISPDGDGKNDAFVIEGLHLFGDNSLKIYNRWGQLVFDRENYENNWVGRNLRGKDLPNDTYFYMLEIKEYNKSYNGFIVIKR